MFWTLLQVFVERAMQTLVFFVAARLIGVVSFGIAAMAIAPSAICVGILQGASQGIIQRRTIESEFLATAFTITVLIGALLGVGVLFSAPILANFMGRPELASLMAATAIAPFAAGLGAVPDGILTKRLAFRLLALRRAAGVTVAGAVCLVLAIAGQGPWSIVVQSVLTVCVISSISLVASGWRPTFGWSGRAARDFGSFSGLVLTTNAAIQANIRLADLIIGYFAGPAAAGTFRLARTIIDLVTSISFNPLATVILPIFSRMKGSEQDQALRLVRIVSVCLLLFCGVAIGVAISARTFAEFTLGRGWSGLGPVLALLGLVYPTMAISSPTQSFMVAVGRPGVNVVSSLGQLVTNLSFIAVGAHWGLLGASIAYVLRAYLAFIGMSIYLARLYSPVRADLARQLLPPLGVSLCTIVLSEIVRIEMDLEASNIAANTALLLLGLGSYFFVIRFIGKATLSDGISLLGMPPGVDRFFRRIFGC